jgi:hypothetical protein
LEYLQFSETGEIVEKIQFAYMSMGQNCGVQNIMDTIRPVIELATNNSTNLQVVQHNHNNLISYVMYMENQIRNISGDINNNLVNTQLVSTQRFLQIESTLEISNSNTTAVNNRFNELISDNNNNKLKLQEFENKWSVFISDVLTTIKGEVTEQNKLMIA